MSEGWDPTGGNASLGLAMALVFASFLPMWALVLWMAMSSSPPSRWVAERRWLKSIAWVTSGLAAILVANVGWISVYRNLIGPDRPTEQRLVKGAAGALALLWIVALAWVKKRRGGGNVSPPSTNAARRNLTTTPILVVLVAWVALAAAFAYLKFGPAATTPASALERTALAVACGVVATLFVLLVRVRREARRTATKDGGDSTGSK